MTKKDKLLLEAVKGYVDAVDRSGVENLGHYSFVGHLRLLIDTYHNTDPALLEEEEVAVLPAAEEPPVEPPPPEEPTP